LAQLNANIQFAVVVRDIQQPLLVVAVFQLVHIAVVEGVVAPFDSDSFAAVNTATVPEIAVVVLGIAAVASFRRRRLHRRRHLHTALVAVAVAVAQPHFLV
jgi:hypothetical protein